MAFTIGTATFTNGSKSVTSVNLTSGSLGYFAQGVIMAVGENPVKANIEAVSAGGGNIQLRNNFPLTTGTYEFTAYDTIEGLHDAVQSARGFQASMESVINSASTSATGDTLAKRDSEGKLNVVGGTASSNAVAYGQLGAGAFSTIKAEDYGIGTAAISITDAGLPLEASGLYSGVGGSGVNFPFNANYGNFINMRRQTSSGTQHRIYLTGSVELLCYIAGTSDNGENWKIEEIHHSGNFIYAQNVSGSTVNKGASVSGANLNPAQSGTWRNVGASTNNGESTIWMKV